MQLVTLRLQFQNILKSPIGKTAVIYPMSFMAGLAGGMVILGMVFFADDRLRATPPQIGMLGATWTFAYVLGCLGMRPLAQRIHPRYNLLAASILLSATVAAICLARTLAWTAVLYACFGLAVALFWPPIMGWLSAGIEGLRLSRAMAWFSMCWSSGSIIGQGLTGWLGDIDTRLPLAMAAMIYLCTAALILGAILALPHLRDEAHASKDAAQPETCAIPTYAMRLAGWLGAFAAFITAGVILNVFPIATRNNLGYSRGMIGFFLFIRALFYAIILGSLGRFNFWHCRGRPMLAGMLLLGLVCTALAFAHSIAQICLIMAGLGALMGYAYTNSLFHGAAGGGDARHRAWQMAIHESVVSGGMIIGSAMGGFIYGYASARLVYMLCAATALGGMLIQAMIFHRRRAA